MAIVSNQAWLLFQRRALLALLINNGNMAKQVKTKNKCSRCQDAFLKGSIRLCNYCGCENDESGKYEVEYCFPCVSHPFEYFLKDRFPIAQWIRKYRPSFVAYDFLAGLTVGLMLVPQAIAYASIAKLPLRVS